VVLLASSDNVGWRNNANSGNVFLGKDSSDRLLWNSQIVAEGSHANGLVIASGTSTLTSGAVTSNTCQTAVTTAATGVATTDAIEWSYATAPGSADALMHVSPYVTSGNVNFTRCNATSASQTGTAIVINWRVIR
jgi:dihydrodipicolinate synthase/N-acetylneuraminate lyase